MNKTADKKNKRTIRLFFSGFSMGTADLVPGVSGGTIAFLLGIYDELLFSIKVVTGKALKLVLQRKFREAFHNIPFEFLIPVVAGIFTAIFALIYLVQYLLDNYASYIWSLFFGLVLCSAYVIAKRVTNWNWKRILLLVASFVATYLLLGLPVMDTDSSPLLFLIVGAIAITAMILPGISGSLILVLLGQYRSLIDSVTDRKIFDVLSFIFGALIGIAIFSRVFSWLLKKYHSAVVAVIVGILIGSLRRVWPWQEEMADKTFVNEMPNFSGEVIGCGVIAIAGFLLILFLEKKGIAKEHQDIDDPEFKEEIQKQSD